MAGWHLNKPQSELVLSRWKDVRGFDSRLPCSPNFGRRVFWQRHTASQISQSTTQLPPDRPLGPLALLTCASSSVKAGKDASAEYVPAIRRLVGQSVCGCFPIPIELPPSVGSVSRPVGGVREGALHRATLSKLYCICPKGHHLLFGLPYR